MAAGDSVQQVKDRLNILDVISPYVELHKAGKNYKGKSPFSPEKTPSFYVSPDRGMYYCFSTSQGGDIFTFIQTMEGVDFRGALKILADKAGVELVPEDPKKKSERERIIALLEAATVYFEGELAQNKDATAYLERRGVSEKTISAWRVGYAPGPPQRGWREVRTHLKSLGYTDEEMLKAGVIKHAQGGKEPFDVFRDRVMFPMAEQNGIIVAYSGRILSKDTDAPKYVNSPETMLYKKSELLFGYDKAKAGIRTLDFSLIVEGQFDVVMCHQAGYHNAVAVSGTALTPHHVGLLERLSSRVVLALDADRAGIAAVKRSAEIMLKRGLDVKVAHMPDGTDPADMIAANPKDFKQVIGRSQHVIEFILTVLKQGSKDDRAFKLHAHEEVVPLLLVMPNRIDQEHFEGVVASALGVSIEAIRYEVERLRTQRAERRTDTPAPMHEQPNAQPAVQPERAQELLEYLLVASEVLPSARATEIKAALSERLGTTEQLAELYAAIPSERASKLSFTIEAYVESVTDRSLKDDMRHRLRQWHEYRTREAVRDVRMRLEAAEQSADSEGVETALRELKDLQVQLSNNPFVEPESAKKS